MQINVNDAKARLSELIAVAERGEEVIITRRGVPIAQIVPVMRRTVHLGRLEGEVPKESLPDFLEPMSEADLSDWGCRS